MFQWQIWIYIQTDGLDELKWIWRTDRWSVIQVVPIWIGTKTAPFRRALLRMLPTVFEEKAENYFKSMSLHNKTLNLHRNLRGTTLMCVLEARHMSIPVWICSLVKGALYCQKSLSYYVSQNDNRTYNTAPLNTVKSILKICVVTKEKQQEVLFLLWP